MEVGRKIKVAVEGNIGCGKSTFLKYFSDYSSNIQVSPEPIELWNNEVFYGNPKQWSTAFQSQVMVTMMKRQAEKQIAPVRILERSVSSCRYIFIEAMNRNEQISDEDLDVFDKFYNHGLSLPSADLDLIVYLRCMPEVCAERIRKRHRKGESNISLILNLILLHANKEKELGDGVCHPHDWVDTRDYLNQLHDLHEEWLIGGKLEAARAPILPSAQKEYFDWLKTTDIYTHRSEYRTGDM
ncbi:hypothetical protein ACTXT7_012380 [Hymenolepis weldensis]